MALPCDVVSLFRACDALSDVCMQHPWGTVTRSPRYPLLRDANNAWVFDAVTPSVEDIRAAVAEAQARFAVPFIQVEVVDTESRPVLVDGLRAWLGAARDTFAFMVAAPGGGDPAPGVVAREVPFPSVDAWCRLIDAAHAGIDASHAGDEAIPIEVTRQIAAWDRFMVDNAGMRLFTVEENGTTVGYATLLSLGGAGLVDSVATLPASRRRGVAAATVRAAMAASTAAGDALTCLFTADGSNAQRLYGRLGFTTVAQAQQFRLDTAV